MPSSDSIPDALPIPAHVSFRLTPSGLGSIRDFRRLLRTPVPWNARTFVLSLMIGSLLSFPMGVLLTALFSWLEFPLPFESSKWMAGFYRLANTASFFVLPFWSHFAFRDQPVLRRLGLSVFQCALLLVMIGSVLFGWEYFTRY